MNDPVSNVATPRAAGYRMPAEWWPHERCLIAWPTLSRKYWGEYYLLAQATHAAVARAVARFEPVMVIANPGEGGNAASYCGSDGIEVVELPIDDSWIRDNGPYFLLGPNGSRGGRRLPLQLVGREVPARTTRTRTSPGCSATTSAGSASPRRWCSRAARSSSTARGP